MQKFGFKVGDTVRVHERIKEGEKSRIQVFQGIVLATRGRGENKMFTVRKLVGDIAVEKIWPLFSPSLEKVEVKESPKKKVRHAKLFLLRKTA